MTMNFTPEFNPRTGVPHIPSRATADLLSPPGAMSAGNALTCVRQSLATTKQSLASLRFHAAKAESDFRRARQLLYVNRDDSDDISLALDKETEVFTANMEAITAQRSHVDGPDRSRSTTPATSEIEYTGMTSVTLPSSPPSSSPPRIIISPPEATPDFPNIASTSHKDQYLGTEIPQAPLLDRAPKRPRSENIPRGPRAMNTALGARVTRSSTRANGVLALGSAVFRSGSDIGRPFQSAGHESFVQTTSRQRQSAHLDWNFQKLKAAWLRSRDRVRECEWDTLVLEADINYLRELVWLRGEKEEFLEFADIVDAEKDSF